MGAPIGETSSALLAGISWTHDGARDPVRNSPQLRHAHDEAHRKAANRAIAVSAIGLGITGGLELGIAQLSGSVGLLGDALHNLSEVSTSLAVFLGFWLRDARLRGHGRPVSPSF